MPLRRGYSRNYGSFPQPPPPTRVVRLRHFGRKFAILGVGGGGGYHGVVKEDSNFVKKFGFRCVFACLYGDFLVYARELVAENGWILS